MNPKAKPQLAVALHYDRSGAPRVVAKGRGSIGEKIIEVAKANNIPIQENEALAGALSHSGLALDLSSLAAACSFGNGCLSVNLHTAGYVVIV